MHRSFGLHGAFQAALNLDRFELSLKKAGSRTFEQSLEEPLDRGEGTSHRVGESTSRGGSGLDFGVIYVQPIGSICLTLADCPIVQLP